MKKLKNTKILKVMIFVINIICINGFVIASTNLGDLENYAQKQAIPQVLVGIIGVVLGVFQTIGSLASIICLIVLGIKYMMGSVEEKANYKKTLFPYVLGAIMVFGISNLLQIIYDIAIGF